LDLNISEKWQKLGHSQNLSDLPPKFGMFFYTARSARQKGCVNKQQNSAQLSLCSAWLSWIWIKYRIGSGSGNPIFLLIFYLVRLWLGCTPKISLIACLEVPQKFVWWVVVGGGGGGGGGGG
jgi:hypothetical protein